MTQGEFDNLSAIELRSAHITALKQRTEANRTARKLEALLNAHKPNVGDRCLILSGKFANTYGVIVFLGKSKASFDVGKNYLVQVPYGDIERANVTAATPEDGIDHGFDATMDEPIAPEASKKSKARKA